VGAVELMEENSMAPSNLKTHVLKLKFDGTHVLNLKNVGAVELTSLSSSKKTPSAMFVGKPTFLC
jgi:hypothetical protein